MEANVAKKQKIKSAEQRLIEAATAEYVEKLRAIFSLPVKADVEISGVPLSKIAHIAEFINDDEGEKIQVHTYTGLAPKHYIDPEIRTNLFRISSISE